MNTVVTILPSASTSAGAAGGSRIPECGEAVADEALQPILTEAHRVPAEDDYIRLKASAHAARSGAATGPMFQRQDLALISRQE
jgi:hypothetical protein